MILYNTTFHIDSSIETEFLTWLKNSFIRSASEFNLSEPMIARLMTVVEPGCSSFAMHLKASDINDINRWENDGRPAVLSDMFNRWGERALAFSTPMEMIEL